MCGDVARIRQADTQWHVLLFLDTTLELEFGVRYMDMSKSIVMDNH